MKNATGSHIMAPKSQSFLALSTFSPAAKTLIAAARVIKEFSRHFRQPPFSSANHCTIRFFSAFAALAKVNRAILMLYYGMDKELSQDFAFSINK